MKRRRGQHSAQPARPAPRTRSSNSRIIISAQGSDPKSVEGEVAELIRRTLALIDRTTRRSPALDADNSNVIDVDAIES